MVTKQKIQIRNPQDIIAVAHRWQKRRQENFLVITLDGSHTVLKLHHVTKGLLNRTIVHPRECFYYAIKDYCAAVAFVHNHPSGKPYPSSEDDEITDRLCKSGKILGIHVLDHVIITPKNDYFSYRKYGKLKDDFEDYDINNFINSIAAEDSIC